jgi:hypothetical protein
MDEFFFRVDLTTAREETEEEDVRVILCDYPDSFFDFEHLVPVIDFIVLVCEHHLHAVVRHPVPSEELHHKVVLVRILVGFLEDQIHFVLPVLLSRVTAFDVLGFRWQ